MYGEVNDSAFNQLPYGLWMMILNNPDGTQTYYETSGQPTEHTLLLLHGLGADHKMWEPQFKSYVAAGYHLLIPDLFGHGQSSALPQLSLLDWHYQLNGLLDALGIESCTLIGVSMGGVIAQSFVVNYPTRVTRMIICDSFGELRTFQEKLLGLLQIQGFRLFKLLGKKSLIRQINSLYQAPFAQKAKDYFTQMSLTLNFDQVIQARKAINQIEVLEDLKSITIPCLVLVGSGLGQGFIEMNRKIANALPHAEFVILEQSMDPSNLVNSAEFDRRILLFLKGTVV